ncbi:MAG TPA: NTP transferase domain-containing protein [Clostridiales bacterium]|nr:NTP transferase domain-containing protein [Clostridiales bacterium]
MKAYILAGGKGTRLAPFNEYRNKAAVPVGNLPLAKRTALALLSVGVSEVVIAGSYRMQELERAFFDMPAVSVLITGDTAGNDRTLAEALAKHPPTGDYVVLFGDCLYDSAELSKLLKTHRENPKAATALLSPSLSAKESMEYITAAAENGRLTGLYGHEIGEGRRLLEAFVATPELTPYLTRCSGLYLNPGIGGMPPKESFLETGLSFALQNGVEIGAILGESPFIDIDKPWNVMEACFLTVERETEALTQDELAEGASIDETAQRKGFVRLGKNSRIGRNVVINGNIIVGDNTIIDNGAILDGPMIIGNNVIMENYCYVAGGSTIGHDTRVLHAAEFEGVLFDGAYLYHYMEIEGLIGTCVDIGASSVCGTLRFDNGDSRHRVRGRLETPRNFANGTYIGDYTRTGVNCTFYPGVTIGCNCAIGPGVVVTDDIPSGQLVLLKQELEFRPWGPERYGW